MKERIENLESIEEIRNVLVEYGSALDRRDFAAYAALFTPDGEWTGGLGSYKGRAAISQMLTDNLGTVEPGFVNASSFHMLTNPHVVVEGDTARATSMFLFWVRSHGEQPVPRPVLAGRYEDEFIRLDGSWLIAKRTAYDLIPYKDPHDPQAPDPGRTPENAHPAPNSIEARLQRVEDELAIRRLLIDYSARLDGRDIDAWIDVFARNGTWRNGEQVHTGPQELRELLHLEFGGEPPVDYNQTQTYQIIHGPQIELDGDRAKVRSRHTLFRRDATGHPQPVLAGIYEDELIREDGEWKFLYRNDNPVMPSREEWHAEQAARRDGQ